jgi:ABC-type phosphate transport system permease subunit
VSQRIEFIVYFVGVLLLGAVYHVVKALVSAPALIIGVLGYLVALRVLGGYLRRKLETREANVAGGGHTSNG